MTKVMANNRSHGNNNSVNAATIEVMVTIAEVIANNRSHGNNDSVKATLTEVISTMTKVMATTAVSRQH